MYSQEFPFPLLLNLYPLGNTNTAFLGSVFTRSHSLPLSLSLSLFLFLSSSLNTMQTLRRDRSIGPNPGPPLQATKIHRGSNIYICMHVCIYIDLIIDFLLIVDTPPGA